MIQMISETPKQIDLQKEFYSQKTALLAKSGYGKSYTARVIIEEGIKKGITFTIIDPQDAYLNLEGFEYVELQNIKNPKAYGTILSQSRRNVVILTKKTSQEEQNKILKEIFTQYKKTIKKGIQTLVIDEGHKFAPEGEKTKAKEIVRGMFQENRSDGLGILIVSQRLSRLDKTILSQADNLFLGRVTSFRDKEAVKNYIDNPDDLEKISELQKGEFYLYGLEDTPQIVQIRKAETKHSGEAPTSILTENKDYYSRYAPSVVKKGRGNMAEDIVKDIVPTGDTALDYAKLGIKVSLGLAVAGVAGNVVSNYIKSPIPVISSRTLGSAGSMVVLYALHKNVPMGKEVTKYAVAGAGAYTLGSLVFDVLDFTNMKIPFVNKAVSLATNVPAVESKAENGNVDLNSVFA